MQQIRMEASTRKNNDEYSKAQQEVAKQIRDARAELKSIAKDGRDHMNDNEVFHFFDEATTALLGLKQNKAINNELLPISSRLRKRRLDCG